MISTTPFITVYIPTHNYEQYIQSAVNSVVNQTYKNWELIIINDGSTDCTAMHLEEYEDYSNIRIYQLNEKQGLIKASNYALARARGEYVIRLDADDWLQTDALEVFAHSAMRWSHINLFYPNMIAINRIGGDIKILQREFKLLNDYAPNGAGCLIKREPFSQIDYYDEEFDCQDGFYLFNKARALGWEIHFLNESLYIYYQHPTSLSHNKIKMHETRLKIAKKHFQGACSFDKSIS